VNSNQSRCVPQSGRNSGSHPLQISLLAILITLMVDSRIQGDEVSGETLQSSQIAFEPLLPSIDANTEVLTDCNQFELRNTCQTFREAFERNLKNGIIGPGDWRSDDKPLFRFRGRIDVDDIVANQSAANKANFGDLPDTGGLRRARLGGQGYFAPDVRYVAEIDLASASLAIRDLYLGWSGFRETGELRAGHLREPFSLEGGTSANSYAFMERSPTNSFDPARNWGIGYFEHAPEELSTLSLGVFHSGLGPNDLRGSESSNNAVTAKWTSLPYYEDEGRDMMHVGIALSSRFPEHGLVVINQTPKSPLLDFEDSSASPFVPKISIRSNFQQLFNTQWAYVSGPFTAQAEWYGNYIDQIGGKPAFYHGSYLNLSYFLTGEHRAYQKQNGIFGAVSVDQPFLRAFSSEKQDNRTRGYGAWELTTQLSYTDTFDRNTPAGPQGQVIGVKLPELTLGVNWYLADRFRIMFNYTHAMPDEPNFGSSSANMFATRMAMYW
jgi:phosphate-selective porin OprO/OprP